MGGVGSCRGGWSLLEYLLFMVLVREKHVKFWYYRILLNTILYHPSHRFHTEDNSLKDVFPQSLWEEPPPQIQVCANLISIVSYMSQLTHNVCRTFLAGSHNVRAVLTFWERSGNVFHKV